MRCLRRGPSPGQLWRWAALCQVVIASLWRSSPSKCQLLRRAWPSLRACQKAGGPLTLRTGRRLRALAHGAVAPVGASRVHAQESTACTATDEAAASVANDAPPNVAFRTRGSKRRSCRPPCPPSSERSDSRGPQSPEARAPVRAGGRAGPRATPLPTPSESLRIQRRRGSPARAAARGDGV
jgi:hypothetical protein